MTFELRLRTLEVRFTHLLITVAFPGTFFWYYNDPLVFLCVICVTLFIYSQFHVLRTFRTALSEPLLAETVFLRRVCFFPAQVVSTTPVIWNCFCYICQTSLQSMQFLWSSLMWFHFSRKEIYPELFPEKHFVIWYVNYKGKKLSGTVDSAASDSECEVTCSSSFLFTLYELSFSKESPKIK